MLSKKEFCDYLKFIEEQQKKQDNLCEALEALADGCYCDFFCYSTYATKLVELLAKNMNANIDDILYYICDLDFGKSCVDPQPFTTAEELYDYLLGENKHE